MNTPTETGETEIKLRRVTLDICEPCIAGEGEECHTPGCAFWMRTPPEWPFYPAMTDREFMEKHGGTDG